MKILCYARPWNVEQFKAIAKSINADAEILITSEHQSIDESGLEEFYYSAVSKKENYGFEASDEELDRDMIKRCRLLRALDYTNAVKHLNWMRMASLRVFDEFQPDLVLSLTIDSFVMDCIFQEARNRNIRFVGLVPSFINGYSRITARGEFNYVREVEEKEVGEVFAKLMEKAYAPAFTQKSKKQPFKSTINRWLMHPIRFLYFSLRRLNPRERYNYHFWASQIVSFQQMHVFPKLKLGDKSWRQKLKTPKSKVYLPLQMIPEATVDYWCDVLVHVDYELTLLKFIDNHGDLEFFIKEHPNVLGFRNPSIYRKLEKFSNVTIIPTYESSNEVLELCDKLCVWTGSAGIEAVLRGKPVISFCKAYYYQENVVSFLESMKGMVSEDCFVLDNDVEKKAYLKMILTGLVNSSFTNDGTWNGKSDICVIEAQMIANIINTFDL